ncbi:RDD family protein [Fulvivirgaceae bacterium BMA12]|uniref:RDD family protein n=1 Tax=Agaribacillus aureus TaxID=3051825 RepID=A0ABT8LDG0_9BACT|nr:RDD family protein [Fulvivirgaceae bacterium BMA12]
MEYPSLVKRYQSTFIDGLVLLTIAYIFSLIFDYIPNISGITRGITFALVYLLYEPLLTARACTLGQWITGIRVRSASDAKRRINYFQSLLRLIIKILLGWLSIFTIPNDPKKRSLHDYAVSSVVYKL